MSTNSLIGIKTENGEIRSVYCHNDGYPSWNGTMLLQHYNTPEKVDALIDLGSISSLNPKLAPEQELAVPIHDNYSSPTTPTRHSFATPHPDVTLAYHRDRGEKLDIAVYSSEDSFYRSEKYILYYYLFKDSQWYLNGHLLTPQIIAEYE